MNFWIYGLGSTLLVEREIGFVDIHRFYLVELVKQTSLTELNDFKDINSRY
jgi:hypothetical protein